MKKSIHYKELLIKSKGNIPKEAWFEGTLENLAFLIRRKKERMFAKGKLFNCFVLNYAVRNNEYIEFLNQLKLNLKKIFNGTKFQLVIYEEKLHHWTTVDIYIRDGKIKSFVLDASNSGDNVAKEIREIFPDGQHYLYDFDIVKDEKRNNDPYYCGLFRYIQTRDIGCRVFAFEHAKQLSKISGEELYKELSDLHENGHNRPENIEIYEEDEPKTITKKIYPYAFSVGEKLTPIFRGAQSFETLNSFPKKVKETILKENKEVKENLLDAANRFSSDISFKNINYFTLIKGIKYKQCLEDFLQENKENKQAILSQRDGLVFIQNPELFSLGPVKK